MSIRHIRPLTEFRHTLIQSVHAVGLVMEVVGGQIPLTFAFLHEDINQEM